MSKRNGLLTLPDVKPGTKVWHVCVFPSTGEHIIEELTLHSHPYIGFSGYNVTDSLFVRIEPDYKGMDFRSLKDGNVIPNTYNCHRMFVSKAAADEYIAHPEKWSPRQHMAWWRRTSDLVGGEQERDLDFDDWTSDWSDDMMYIDVPFDDSQEPVEVECRMTLQEFIESCQSGCYIDDDGYGKYANGDLPPIDRVVFPSQVFEGKIDHSFTHVVWYNR